MFAELKDAKLYYEESGEGEVVVLIGGIASNHRFWKKLVPMLEGYRVITFDNRGVGDTEYDGSFTIFDLADDVIHLLDALGVEKAHIVGWSMGSLVSQAIAIRHSDRMQSLTLLSTYHRRPERSHYMMWNLCKLAVEGKASNDALNIGFNALCLTEGIFQDYATAGQEVPIPRKPMDPVGIMDQIDAMNLYDSHGMLKDIRVPTLVIHGASDTMVPVELGISVHEEIKGSELYIIPNQGHTIPIETYSERLVEHLNKNKM